MSVLKWTNRATDSWAPWIVSLIGIGLLSASVVLFFTVIYPSMRTATPSRIAFLLVELIGLGIPPTGLIYLGADAVSRDDPPAIQWKLVLWTLIGLGAVTAVVTAIAVHRTLNGFTVNRSLLFIELVTGAGVGGLLGAFVGVGRASIYREQETVAAQRDAFLFLNRLLRHHILNSITVIDGFVRHVRTNLNGQDAAHFEMIRDHTDRITTLIQNVDTVVTTYTGDPPVRSIDIAPILQEELEQVQADFPAVTVTGDIPATIVMGNELIRVAFRNVFDNAARYNDASDPRITVTIEEHEDHASVRVQDNGPGIDQDVPELLEVGDQGDRGMGLYLASRLVSQLGGQLRVTNGQTAGTTVVFELPVPEGEPDRSADSEWPMGPPIGQIS